MAEPELPLGTNISHLGQLAVSRNSPPRFPSLLAFLPGAQPVFPGQEAGGHSTSVRLQNQRSCLSHHNKLGVHPYDGAIFNEAWQALGLPVTGSPPSPQTKCQLNPPCFKKKAPPSLPRLRTESFCSFVIALWATICTQKCDQNGMTNS